MIAGVDVVNANSVDGTQGTLTVSLAEGVTATEIAWFNSSGLQIGTGESVTVVNPGTFSVLVTTEDCVSEFGGWVVIDEGLDCTMTADVTVTNTDENESNGALVVTVEGAEGPWSATWYDADGAYDAVLKRITDAQGEIYTLMARDNFPRFTKSDAFAGLLVQIGSYDASVASLVSQEDLTMLVQDGEGLAQAHLTC